VIERVMEDFHRFDKTLIKPAGHAAEALNFRFDDKPRLGQIFHAP
jgi:hypothetical protein